MFRLLQVLLLYGWCVFSAVSAEGNTLYRWVNAQGVVTYSDLRPGTSRPARTYGTVNTPYGLAAPRTASAPKSPPTPTPLDTASTPGHKTAALASAAGGGMLLLRTTPTAAASGIPPLPARLADYNPPFPRLLGMNIGAKNYGDPAYLMQLSRLNVVILGFYKGWRAGPSATIRSVVGALRAMNPDMLVGQYTILSEAYDNAKKHVPEKDISDKLTKENWWVRDPAGNKVQWTPDYQAWQTNFTTWSQPDARGRRFPQWLAKRNYDAFFNFKPGFDIWYSDNVSATAPVGGDWKNNGRTQSRQNPAVAAAYRAGEASYWVASRALDPNVLMMGNADNDLSFPEYKDQLNGVFLEGLMGQPWSIVNWGGWNRMMDRYHTVFDNLLAPRIVGFNAQGSPTDYRFFRYAFTSCLMDNGYFSYTDKSVGYSSVPWFDEYDVKLGYPVDPPQTQPWQNGVYKRAFQHGLALVNPTNTPETVSLPPNTWKHFYGSQDPMVNNGQAVTRITLPPRDGVLLVR